MTDVRVEYVVENSTFVLNQQKFQKMAEPKKAKSAAKKSGKETHLSILFDSSRVERKKVKALLASEMAKGSSKVTHTYVQFRNGRDALNCLVNDQSENVHRLGSRGGRAIANELNMHENSVAIFIGPFKDDLQNVLHYMIGLNSIRVIILPSV